MKSMKALALTIIAASLFALQTKAQVQDTVNIQTTNNQTEWTTGKVQRPWVKWNYAGLPISMHYNGIVSTAQNGIWSNIDVSDNLAAHNYDVSGNVGGTWDLINDSIEGQPVHIVYRLNDSINAHHGVIGRIDMKINEYDIEGLINYTDTATGNPASLTFKLPNQLYKEWMDADTTAPVNFESLVGFDINSNPQKLDSILNNINITMVNPSFEGYKENLAQMNETSPFSAQGDSITSTLENISGGGINSPWNPVSATFTMTNYGSTKSSKASKQNTEGAGPEPDLDDIVYKSAQGTFTVTQLAPDSVITHPGAEWGNTYRYTFSDPGYEPLVTADANGLPTNVVIKQVNDTVYDVTVSVKTPEGSKGSYQMTVNLDDTLIVGVPELPRPDYEALNYPNPFLDNTTLRYSLKEKDNVHIAIYNMAGQLMDEFEQKDMLPGTHELNINGSGYAKGMYFVNITGKEGNTTIKLMKQR
jgi:hypothetical protein